MVSSGVPTASNYPNDPPCGTLAETMDRLALTDHWMCGDRNNDIAEEPEVAQIIKQKRISDRLSLQASDTVNGHEKESFQCKSALADILKSHTPTIEIISKVQNSATKTKGVAVHGSLPVENYMMDDRTKIFRELLPTSTGPHHNSMSFDGGKSLQAGVLCGQDRVSIGKKRHQHVVYKEVGPATVCKAVTLRHVTETMNSVNDGKSDAMSNVVKYVLTPDSSFLYLWHCLSDEKLWWRSIGIF